MPRALDPVSQTRADPSGMESSVGESLFLCVYSSYGRKWLWEGTTVGSREDTQKTLHMVDAQSRSFLAQRTVLGCVVGS